METMEMKPSAHLLSYTQFPIGLLYYIWERSRHDNQLETPYHYDRAYHLWRHDHTSATDYTLEMVEVGKKVNDTVQMLLFEDVPVLENISFTFELRNVPIALREQLVRHRIGVKVGDRLGVDIIPELASSTFWAQTSRVLKYGDLYTSRKFSTPKTIDQNEVADAHYETFMSFAEETYHRLIDAGIPVEDARMILPLASESIITWTLNLKALMHILGKRACWIAQFDLWGSILRDMRVALTGVSPLFANVIQPPCFDKGQFVSCPIGMVNRDRIRGTDPYPPCPMYLNYNFDSAVRMPDRKWDATIDRSWLSSEPGMTTKMETMKKEYEELWGRDSKTGELLSPDR